MAMRAETFQRWPEVIAVLIGADFRELDALPRKTKRYSPENRVLTRYESVARSPSPA